MFLSTAIAMAARGRTMTARSPNVITVIESARFPHSHVSSLRMSGQVVTVSKVAHTIAPRNGLMIQNGATIRRAMNSAAMIVRVRSGRGSGTAYDSEDEGTAWLNGGFVGVRHHEEKGGS